MVELKQFSSFSTAIVLLLEIQFYVATRICEYVQRYINAFCMKKQIVR